MLNIGICLDVLLGNKQQYFDDSIKWLSLMKDSIKIVFLQLSTVVNRSQVQISKVPHCGSNFDQKISLNLISYFVKLDKEKNPRDVIAC